MPAKKSAIETKEAQLRSKPRHQIGWFIGLYLASVVAMGLFYGFSHWFVGVLK